MAVYLSTGDRVKTTHELVEFWVEHATTKRAPDERGEYETKSSIQCEGDRLFHYGHHFELARVLRTKGGRPRLILLNGDSYNAPSGWGTSTASRQSEVRGHVAKTDVPYIVLPFSALDAAGIAEDSIVPLEVRPDRRETLRYSSPDRPGAHVKMDDPSGATYPHTEQRHGYVHMTTGEVRAHGEVTSDERESYRWGPYDHTSEKPVQVDDPKHAHVDKTGQHEWSHHYAELREDGLWHWTTERHWLGDSLFKARVTEERTRPASEAEVTAFEENERWSKRWRELRNVEDAARNHNSNVWFIDRKYEREESLTLGENPPPRPTPEEQAHAENAVIDAVRAVRAHEENRPDSVTHAERHRGTGRLIVRHTVRRWAKFLSSFDYNEPHRPYFLCELRHGCPANTVEEAIEDLKPQRVKDALAAGVDVLRHGDVFLIPTAYTTDELQSRAKTVERTRTRQLMSEPWSERVTTTETIRSKHYGESEVLGTNHSPTHAILTKDGEWYARGRMYHTPRQSWRNPEHRTVVLGDGETWYVCVKNTVPLDKGTGGSRGNGVRWQPGGGRVFTSQSRAWMLGGAVD